MRHAINCSDGSAKRTFSAFPVWIAFLMVRILLGKGMELVVKLECWSLDWNDGFSC